MRKILSGILLMVVLSVLTVSAVFADAPEKTDGFVCPVLGGQAGADRGNSDPEKIQEIDGGDYTVANPDVSVSEHATNDEGDGSPGGDHASSGDPGYTAIWDKD
ncbi:MAG: hypothetical protein A2Z14_16980 [Chloroflexi bacterium RBG_16_48_8]|nr:MAG: hypothetical protein A2Z14_16980 [Chloroflexi bacterium RBG_16_48_8]